MKIYPVGADFIHADERTDRRRDNVKLIVAFRSFANAPKNAPSNCNPHLEQAATPGNTPARDLQIIALRTCFWSRAGLHQFSAYAGIRSAT
jgi:hypothetical protein